MFCAIDHSGTRFSADDARRDRDYLCQGCSKPVVLKQGDIRYAHFAHHDLSQCQWGAGEGPDHIRVKTDIKQRLRREGWEVDPEHRVETERGRFISDLFVSSPTRYFAVEVQKSHMTKENYLERAHRYRAAQVPVLWVLVAPMPILGQLVHIARFKRSMKVDCFGMLHLYEGDGLVRSVHIEDRPRFKKVRPFGELSLAPWFPTDKNGKLLPSPTGIATPCPKAYSPGEYKLREKDEKFVTADAPSKVALLPPCPAWHFKASLPL